MFVQAWPWGMGWSEAEGGRWCFVFGQDWTYTDIWNIFWESRVDRHLFL